MPNWLWGPELSLLLAAGVVAYLLIRVVRDDGADHIGRLAAKIGIGIVLLALAAGGFTAAAAGSALGGGVVIAGLIVACGVGLVGGAFRGGARWLIAPAIVLALPLAAVAATDLDVRGTWGDRTFRPATAADLDRGYEMGVGAMKVDLRDVELPAGRTDLHLDLGMGEIQVLVPEDLCVTTDTTIGVGAVDTGDGEQGGIDLDVESNARVSPGTRHLHVIADVGVGAVRVGDRDVAFARLRRPRHGRPPGHQLRRLRGDGVTPRPGFDPASLIAGVILIVLGAAAPARPGRRARPRHRLHAPGGAGRRRRHPAGLRSGRPAPRTLVCRVGTSATVTHPETTRAAPLRRDPAHAVFGGVCAGLAPAARRRPARAADRLRRSPALAGGIGVALYVLCWAVIPAGRGTPSRGRALAASFGGRERLQVAGGIVLLTLAVLLLFRAWGLWVGDAVVWPLVLLAGGGALIWRQSQCATVVEPPVREQALPGGGAGRPRRGLRLSRPSVGFVSLGAALVVGAALVFLWLNGALVPDRDVTLAVFVVIVAMTVILAPWWLRLGRGLTEERAERIRTQERAELAAHLHDSVLQTLALMQKRAATRARSPRSPGARSASCARG